MKIVLFRIAPFRTALVWNHVHRLYFWTVRFEYDGYGEWWILGKKSVFLRKRRMNGLYSCPFSRVETRATYFFNQIKGKGMYFSKQFPHIDWWVKNNGWMVVGTDEDSDCLVRLIDTTGTSWEDEDPDSIDVALWRAEMFLTKALPLRFPNRFKIGD